MRISVELVPRSEASIRDEVGALRAAFPSLDTVNIPDLLRFPLRSWDACALARRVLPRAIPHVRAMDFKPEAPGPLLDALARTGADEVIVVRGDPPQDMARRIHPTRADELIGALRRARPELTIWAALDPYRAGFRDELEHAHRKRDAGADGFFTQPFFDLRLCDVWAELLPDVPVYWGVTPVVSRASRRYWETKNRAILPAGWNATLDASRTFAREALAWARARDANLYFMPIRVSPTEYLEGVL